MFFRSWQNEVVTRVRVTVRWPARAALNFRCVVTIQRVITGGLLANLAVGDWSPPIRDLV